MSERKVQRAINGISDACKPCDINPCKFGEDLRQSFKMTGLKPTEHGNIVIYINGYDSKSDICPAKDSIKQELTNLSTQILKS